MVFLGAFSSCKKDELNSKELLAFIKTNGLDIHTTELSFKRTGTVVTGDLETKFTAYLTRETSSDVMINLAVDESKVESYNKTNKTNYVLLPAVNYKFLTGNQLTIKSGNTIATDYLKIQLEDREKLSGDNIYILPLSIKEITGDDKGVTTSENYRTVYIIVKCSIINIDPANTLPVGTIINRTGWVVSSSGSYSSNVINRILDGDNNTAWDSNGEMPAWVMLDMLNPNTVKGFSFVPSYEYTTDNFIVMEVLSSNDGIGWKSHGEYIGTETLASSSASNPDLKNVNFTLPVTARYFKFNITKTTDGKYAGMAEINAIQ